MNPDYKPTNLNYKRVLRRDHAFWTIRNFLCTAFPIDEDPLSDLVKDCWNDYKVERAATLAAAPQKPGLITRAVVAFARVISSHPIPAIEDIPSGDPLSCIVLGAALVLPFGLLIGLGVLCAAYQHGFRF